MPHSSQPERPIRRARRLTLTTLVSGVLVAGCGGSSGTPIAAGGGAAPTTSTGGGATSSRAAAASSGASGPLAFAKCMRAHGVPGFPDPKPGDGAVFIIPTAANPAAPAFRAALARCQTLIGGAPAEPGSTTHPSAQTLARLLRIAQCMRRHGISQFPDPRTSVPLHPSGFQQITDFDGAILLLPGTLDLQAPAYRKALTACGAPPLGLAH